MKFEDTPEYKDIRIAALLKENAKLVRILSEIQNDFLRTPIWELDWNELLGKITEGLNGKHVQRRQNDEELEYILKELDKATK